MTCDGNSDFACEVPRLSISVSTIPRTSHQASLFDYMTKTVKYTTKVVLTSPCKWSIIVLVIQVAIKLK